MKNSQDCMKKVIKCKESRVESKEFSEMCKESAFFQYFTSGLPVKFYYSRPREDVQRLFMRF